MTLEELAGKVGLMAGKPFGINPNIKYDPHSKPIRAEFVKRCDTLFDIEGYYSSLKENANDVDTLNDIAEIVIKYMAGNTEDEKKNNMFALRDPHIALEKADALKDEGYFYLAKFVENNRKEIFDHFSAQDLYKLINNPNLPFFKTGDKDHDKIINLRNKFIQMQEASSKNSDITPIFEKEIKELTKSMPEAQRKFFKINSFAYQQSLVHAIVGQVSNAYGSIFKMSDGKTLDKDELRNFLEDNYKVIEDMGRESDRSSNEIFERWDKNLKPHYVEIARQLHGPEKKQAKRDKDEEKEDRKEADKKLGVRT